MRKLLIVICVLAATLPLIGQVRPATVISGKSGGASVSGDACSIFFGTGNPEGSVVGKPCDVYISTNGNIYQKDSGSGTDNSGWTAKATGAGSLPSASDDQVAVYNGSVWEAKTVPNCTDSGGNHLNYAQASNAFSCGTSSSGGGGGGALVFREAHTASNSASLDFTSWYDAAYDTYVIEIVNLLPASNTEVLIRMSTDGGSSYDSGSNYATITEGGFPTTTTFASGANSNSAISLRLSTNTTLDTNGSYNASLRLFNPGGSRYKFLGGHAMFSDSSLGLVSNNVAGTYKSTTAVNAFRIVCASGNITSGVVRVYGIATS